MAGSWSRPSPRPAWREGSEAARGADRAPDPLGGSRHVEVIDAERGQRVDDRAQDGLRGSDASGLARALDTERVGSGRQLLKGDVEGRQIVGARHGIIRQRPAQQLAGSQIVDGVLQKGLTNTLCNPALDLAHGQHRVDQTTIVVDDRVALNGDGSGIRVDLDLGDMAAVGEGEYIGLVEYVAIEARCHAIWKAGWVVRRPNYRRQVAAAGGALH